MEPLEQFSHFALVIPVADINVSLAYYQDKLGFTCDFTWKDPPEYAVLRRGGVSVHLTLGKPDERSRSDAPIAYVFVHNVDLVYAQLVSSGAEISEPVADREYGMRDFDIKDPDGYCFTFGTGLNQD